jgi:hypothetical protein
VRKLLHPTVAEFTVCVLILARTNLSATDTIGTAQLYMKQNRYCSGLGDAKESAKRAWLHVWLTNLDVRQQQPGWQQARHA